MVGGLQGYLRGYQIEPDEASVLRAESPRHVEKKFGLDCSLDVGIVLMR